MSHFNNNPRDRGRINQIPVRDTYYNNVPPANHFDNSQERCLFTNGNNQFNKVTQNNNVNFDNSLKSDNMGRFIYEQDYVNKPLLDNNIFEEVRNEYIEEKDIIIDTMDRDTTLYPNIFDFRVKLGSTDTTPGPSIHRSVENVKYLKLVKCIFPDNYKIKKSTHTLTNLQACIKNFINSNFGDLNTNTNQYDATHTNSSETIYIAHYYTSDGKFTIDYFRMDSTTNAPDYNNVYSAVVNTLPLTNSSTIDEHNLYNKDSNDDFQVEKGRFFQLHIDQLPKNNDLSTNDSVRGSFSVLYPGKEDDRGFNILDGMETDKIFRFSNLGTFNTMNIKILNCAGDQVDGDNSSMWNTQLIANEKKSGKNITNTNNNTKNNYPSSFRSASKYLRHPLAWKMQAHLIFTVGEVRIEMNKRTFN
jgi:hypothetical protein